MDNFSQVSGEPNFKEAYSDNDESVLPSFHSKDINQVSDSTVDKLINAIKELIVEVVLPKCIEKLFAVGKIKIAIEVDSEKEKIAIAVSERVINDSLDLSVSSGDKRLLIDMQLIQNLVNSIVKSLISGQTVNEGIDRIAA